MCVFVHVCIFSCVLLWGVCRSISVKIRPWVFWKGCVPFYFWQGVSLTRGSPMELDWLLTKSQDLVSTFSALWLQALLQCLTFSCGLWELNSVPHACKANNFWLNCPPRPTHYPNSNVVHQEPILNNQLSRMSLRGKHLLTPLKYLSHCHSHLLKSDFPVKVLISWGKLLISLISWANTSNVS